jgi:tetratricopeptide (TPR) repeat protein
MIMGHRGTGREVRGQRLNHAARRKKRRGGVTFVYRIGLLLLCLVPAGCHRGTPAAAGLPPPPTFPAPTLEVAEAFYGAGDYAGATQAYETYLKENPSAEDRDKALFRLAMSYALLGNSPESFRKAQNLLRTLFTQFPRSQYKPEAQYILSLQADIDRMKVDIREKDDLIREQSEAPPQVEKVTGAKDRVNRAGDKALREKDKALREKDKIIQEKEEKILKLTQELERMKKIDLQRAPSRSPD